MARRVVQPPEIVARQEGREDASVNLMADARLHLWMQPRAEQQHQFRELSPGQRREQPHLRIGDIRQIGVMRGQLPTALLADRPGHIQQWIEEPALIFQAFRQGEIGQRSPPAEPGRFILLAAAAAEEFEEQRGRQRRDRLAGGDLSRRHHRAHLFPAKRLFDRGPRAPIGGRRERRQRALLAQDEIHLDRIVLAQHPGPVCYQKNALRPRARSSASTRK